MAEIRRESKEIAGKNKKNTGALNSVIIAASYYCQMIYIVMTD
jgi:hypothetical protein